MDKQIKDMAVKIGEFYLTKYTYDEAVKRIRDIGFVSLCIQPEYNRFTDIRPAYLKVIVRRPGLFIGPRGQNVIDLESFLGIKIKIFESKDVLEDYIIPDDPKAMDDDYDCMNIDDMWLNYYEDRE